MAPVLWYKFHRGHAMPRMLVVDDDAASCRLVAAIFREENIEVTTAPNGTIGLARVDEVQPDIILLDIRMPDVDGLEVLQRLRPQERGIPVVMLTAEHDVKHAVRAMQL